MDIDRVVELIPPVIVELKKEYAFSNDAIKDGIFRLLEKHCTVVYYPLNNEKTRGFHVKRFVKDRREDFVFINTANPVSEQIFGAAHELGHVWEVANKILKEMPGQSFTPDEEEIVINRFAAELLMPQDIFRHITKFLRFTAEISKDFLRSTKFRQVMDPGVFGLIIRDWGSNSRNTLYSYKIPSE